MRSERLVSDQGVNAAFHTLRVDTPAGLLGDVLFAVNCIGRRHAGHAGRHGGFPQGLTVGRVEYEEFAIVGAAGEHEVTAGSEDYAPHKGRELVRPYLFAGGNNPSRDINLVAIERTTAVDRMQLQHLGRYFSLAAPQFITGSGVDRDQLRAGLGDVHITIVNDGRGLVAFCHAGRERPGELQSI